MHNNTGSEEMNLDESINYLKGKGFRYGGQWISLHWRKLHHIVDCMVERFKINKHEMEELLSVLHMDQTNPDLLQMNIRAMDECPYKRINCDRSLVYRTHDGSCNNLQNPYWGKALIPLHSNLRPDYCDGWDAPRCSVSGSPLPPPRNICLGIFRDQDHPSEDLTFMFMSYGQLLAHDTGLTGVAVLFNNTEELGGHRLPGCGYDGCQTDKVENFDCLPIPISADDPAFKNKTCLKFIRSLPVPDPGCTYSYRQQLNQITSYIDASFVYGSSDDQSAIIRDTSQATRGKLLTTVHLHPHWQPLLPKAEVGDCKGTNKSVKCFLAGDPRVNEHITLVSLHTAFVRIHNRIEDKLYSVNPHWDCERLYQESRRILGAMVQHVTYKEYVPLVLGDDLMKEYNLHPLETGYWRGYDPKVRPDATNSFQTAAFRFGHSMISNTFRLMANRKSKFEDVFMTHGFFRPQEIYKSHGIDRIIFGMAVKPIQVADRHFADQVTRNLFTKSPPHGMGTDLVSLNIQRGRDHGLPGYNHFRRWCGLPTGKKFNKLPGIPDAFKNKLASLYEDVEDIDLYVGGLMENLLTGASVGPTFGCIIARQFQNLRAGDRFWYETGQERIRFTEAQLYQIRRVRLAKLLCDVSDGIDHIQPWVFLQPHDSEEKCQADSVNCQFNQLMPCSEYHEIDFRAWKEK